MSDPNMRDNPYRLTNGAFRDTPPEIKELYNFLADRVEEEFKEQFDVLRVALEYGNKYENWEIAKTILQIRITKVARYREHDECKPEWILDLEADE